jgi:hypothetical protein
MHTAAYQFTDTKVLEVMFKLPVVMLSTNPASPVIYLANPASPVMLSANPASPVMLLANPASP